MTAFARFAQSEHGAPRHHLAAVRQEHLDQVFQVAQLGLAVDQRHHVDTEVVLQLRLLVEVVEHHLGHFAALELDDQAHAGLVALVLNVADAFDFLFMDQLGHALLQRLFVDLVGQLVHDDGLALTFVDVFKVALGAHHHPTAAGAVTVTHAIDAVNDAACREVRAGNDFHQILDAGLGVFQHVQAGIDHFVQVVRRNVGRHAHGNSARAIDQQVGNA